MTTFRSIALLLVFAVALTGCSAVSTLDQADTNPLGDLKAFVKKDVSSAHARALKAKDAGAPFRARCYATMLKYIPEDGASVVKLETPAGLVDAFELAAEKIGDVQSGGALKVPEDLQADCGYLKDEIGRFALRMGMKFAPVPGVGAAGGLLR